jgi:hypothetical protein
MIVRLPVVATLLHLTASALAAQGGQSTPPAMRWSGYIQARETYQDEVGLTGSVNRARLSAAGSVAGDVSWQVQGEFRTGSAGRSASVPTSPPLEAWTVGANVRPWGRATKITLEYVSRETGDPGVRRGLGLAQFQVIF